jgi:transcriptional regulator
MHVAPQFLEDRLPVLHDLMRKHPFATLVAEHEDGPLIDHVPLLLDTARGEYGVLIGHVARANPLWRALEVFPVVSAVFHGPACYISPSWYPAKAEHGRVVPTWNYTVVHARGRARTVHDAQALEAIVDALTSAHEAGREPPWQIRDAPADFIEAMLHGIVGFEIEIEALDGKWKLGQNRPVADRVGVVQALCAAGGDAAIALAALMAAT